MSAYQKMILEVLERNGRTEIDPRVIEAWMRSEHATLDGLSPTELTAAVIQAWSHAQVSEASANAGLAASFGLMSWEEAEQFDELKKGARQ